MNDRHRPINSLQRPQYRQYNGVVATKTKDSWVFPSVCSTFSLHASQSFNTMQRTLLSRGMVKHLPICLFHLLECVIGIERRNGHITTIDLVPGQEISPCMHVARTHYLQTLLIRVNTPHGVVTPALLFPRRPGAYATGTKTCSGAVRGRCVIWKP